MPNVESELDLLRNPRLAVLATSASPVWLWSADASRILWANAVGAALFGATETSELEKRRFNLRNPAAAPIPRLAATLPSSGPPRLERLRGFGLGFNRALTCACSRIVLPDGNAAVLVAAVEPAGPALALGERVRRLFADDGRTLAVFASDGTLLHATAPAQARLDGAIMLSALGIDAAAAEALEAGRATAVTRIGDATLERLGEAASRVIVLTLKRQTREAPTETRVPENTEPAHAALTPEVTDTAPSPPSATEAAPAGPPQPATDATSATAEPPPSAQSAPPDEPMLMERRHPLRFVWQMDDDGRFVVGSDEFIEIVGPRTTAAFGRLWSEIAAELKLDPENQVVRAIATRETWSGITVSWPVDETSQRLPVELSGLPVFDRNRNFRGYRGFGVCRDIAHINQVTRSRRERPIGFMPAPETASGLGVIEAPAPQGAVGADTAAAAAPSAMEAPARVERPALSVAPAAANVVPFRPGPPAEPKSPSLSPVERRAFRELAQELTARLRGTQEIPAAAESGAESVLAEAAQAMGEGAMVALAPLSGVAPPAEASTAEPAAANESTASAVESGGIDARQHSASLIEPSLLDRIPLGVLVYRHDALIHANRHFLQWSGYESLDALAAAGGLNSLFVESDAGTLADSGGAQSLSIMTRHGDKLPVDGRLFTIPWNGASALALILTNGQDAERRRANEVALAAAESEIRELKSSRDSDAAVREKSEEELRNATREAQKAAAAKAEFLAKISHEIRTPLNAIAGFAEVIMAERFGPIGNERYREYLKDIHAAGTHLVSLLNDLLDLSKIETGQLDLTFADVTLNDLTQQCVAIMQPQANRARIIIRTALTPGLPQVIADERSLRQIVLNLLANSIRFTGPGGQVIVSTAVSDSREVVLRVRDTGVGMSEKDIEAALEPFRQTATSGSWGSGGTGLGLPLTKALAEANRAIFGIKSAPNAGTLVEIAFPPSRVVAE